MHRREFLDKLAKGASLGLLLQLSPLGMRDFVLAQSSANAFAKALLVDKDGKPFKLSSLEPHQPMVFAYPFAATPNILVNLGTEIAPAEVKLAEGSYRWPGGAGKNKGVVAYTSICPHAYSYTAPNLGAMGYAKPEGERGPRMVCCTHLSAFDIAKGGEVKGGPAPHALAAVALEYNPETDEAYASGFLGNPQFDAFFRAQNQNLRDLFKPIARAREKVEKALVVPYSDHTKVPTTCPVLG